MRSARRDAALFRPTRRLVPARWEGRRRVRRHRARNEALFGPPSRSEDIARACALSRAGGGWELVWASRQPRLARVTDSPLPLLTRLWFAWATFFRVLFDGVFAARVFALPQGGAESPRLSEPGPAATRATPARPEPKPAEPRLAAAPDAREGALQLLGLLQREGRFVDFVQQDISRFPDADVGAAARVVHEGCRRALGSHATIVSVRTEAEGSPVVVERMEGDLVKLTGHVSGSAPYRGVLRHRGWRIETLKLPQRVGTQDLSVVAPAEVEL